MSGETRLEDRARRCGIEATAAVCQLLGATPTSAEPRSWALRDAHLPAELHEPDARVAAVFAQLQGGMSGLAVVVLPRPTLERILNVQVGDPEIKTLDERGFSALCELGNIAASAAANALSEMVGQIVLPSVPRLTVNLDARTGLSEVVGDLEGQAAQLLETRVSCDGDELSLLFVWIEQA